MSCLPGDWRARGLVVDLDGVVYRGGQACEGAADGLHTARAQGLPVLFLTNNAGRTPADIAEQLTSLGVRADPREILTSAQVAAEVLASAQWISPAGTVLAVGGPGVALALREQGLPVVTPADISPDAGGESDEELAARVDVLVLGFGREVNVRDLTEATFALARGARWLATNDDASIPLPRGNGPGAGALTAAVSAASGRRPDLVVGKPHPPAYRTALRRLGLAAEDVLAIGDRLDTDVQGARRAGLRAALVLTGVHDRADAAAAAEPSRPDVVAATIPDLSHLWR